MDRLVMTPPDRGVLFVVSGPSGVGKSTLIRRALDKIPGLRFSVSATTRPAREGEADGTDYYFISDAAFESRVQSGQFLEHASVYGCAYGTLAEPTRKALERGECLVLDIDVAGATQIRTSLPDATHIFILPPDRATLEARLRTRATDSEEVIERRLEEMDEQLGGCGDYDYVVVNDDLETSHRVFQGILLAEMSRASRRYSTIRPWSSPS